jgi:hypothetical protein
MSKQEHCVCDAQYYKVISNRTAMCQTCPKGGVCTFDSSCALARPPNFTCPTASGALMSATGTWSLDGSNGKYYLRDCPEGYTLVSPAKAGSEDLQECKACLSPSQYILRPTDDCQICPPGLVCNGGPDALPSIKDSVWVRNGSIYLLELCPAGYQVQASSPTTQQCAPCGKGTECTVGPCVTCFSCRKGFYKSEVGTLPCQPCPVDTYGAMEGGQDANTACNKCPAQSGTVGKVGQNSVGSCICNPGYYLDTVETSQTKGQCLTCPAGATCPGGVAPLFGEVVTQTISLSISASDYCCDSATQDKIMSALAQSLGIDPSSIVIQSPCANVKCGTRREHRSFVITSAELTAALRYLIGPFDLDPEDGEPPYQAHLPVLQAHLPVLRAQADGMQLQFTAVMSTSANTDTGTFSQTFSALSNISATVVSSKSSGSLDSAGQVYGPVDAQGQYHLLGCRQGYILVNDTIATQSCIACTSGTYSLNPMDGCSAGWVCPQRSVCIQCPAGATCSGLSNFKPIIANSIWAPVLDQTTRTTVQHLISCPPGAVSL